MSQHADILSHEITKGIKRGHLAAEIAGDIMDLLTTLDYDDSFTEYNKVTEHVYYHARGMAAQKDGLYGISHEQLDKFITELWIANQWLTA